MQPNLNYESTKEDDEEIKYITNVLKNDFNLYETNEESLKRQKNI